MRPCDWRMFVANTRNWATCRAWTPWGVCAEPAAHSAVDARGQRPRQSAARLFGATGGFSLDDPGRQHAGELCGREPGRDRTASPVQFESRRVLGDFFG